MMGHKYSICSGDCEAIITYRYIVDLFIYINITNISVDCNNVVPQSYIIVLKKSFYSIKLLY